jgi:hypothetical protein
MVTEICALAFGAKSKGAHNAAVHSKALIPRM